MAEVRKVTADTYGEGRGLDIAAGRDSDRWLVVNQPQTIWQEGASRHSVERFRWCRAYLSRLYGTTK